MPLTPNDAATSPGHALADPQIPTLDPRAVAAAVAALDPGAVTTARVTEMYGPRADRERQIAAERLAKSPPVVPGNFERVHEYSADHFPDRCLPAILSCHTSAATIEADAGSLPDRISAVVGRASKVRAEIGSRRADLLAAHEAAQAELRAAQERAYGPLAGPVATVALDSSGVLRFGPDGRPGIIPMKTEQALRILDHQTDQNKRRCDRIESIGRDLGNVYASAVAYLRIDAELVHRESALIDQLAAIPENDRLPEPDDGERREYLTLTPAQQITRQLRTLGRTIKAAALGLDRESDVSLDYRAMICNAFGLSTPAEPWAPTVFTRGPSETHPAGAGPTFKDAPRRWQIFGAMSAEIGPDGRTATGRFQRSPGDIDRLETALAEEIAALYRDFPAADPNRSTEEQESTMVYRITAGGDTNGRRRGQTIELLPSDAERINREWRQLHSAGPARLTLESSLPQPAPIPIPAKRT